MSIQPYFSPSIKLDFDYSLTLSTNAAGIVPASFDNILYPYSITPISYADSCKLVSELSEEQLYLSDAILVKAIAQRNANSKKFQDFLESEEQYGELF